MIQELIQGIRDRRVILFVGAGLSQNLGLPSHRRLIEHLAEELGYDPNLFATHGDHLTLAEYYQIEKGSIGPLRSWMDRAWHAGVDISKSELHKLIVDLNFPIIYTTNYDRWLESAHDQYHRRYVKIANVGDLAKVESNLTQIVKFHGDFEDDKSIVLTESSYFERMDFESPLDLKLRSDLLSKSVLFIGYSLADINLRYMLYKINSQWKNSDFASERPKSFIFLTRPNPVQTRVLANRGIFPIVSDQDEPGIGLREFLRGLVADIPVRQS
jgi:hypothetical protein